MVTLGTNRFTKHQSSAQDETSMCRTISRQIALLVCCAGLSTCVSTARADLIFVGVEQADASYPAIACSSTSGFDHDPSSDLWRFMLTHPFDPVSGLVPACGLSGSNCAARSSSCENSSFAPAAIESQQVAHQSNMCVRLVLSICVFVPDAHLHEVFHPPKSAA